MAAKRLMESQKKQRENHRGGDMEQPDYCSRGDAMDQPDYCSREGPLDNTEEGGCTTRSFEQSQVKAFCPSCQ